MCASPPPCKPDSSACASAAQCCSGVCAYPTPFSEKQNCLPATFACGPTLLCKTAQEYCDMTEGIVVGYGCRPLPASCLPPSVADCGCMPIAPDCGSCKGTTDEITEAHGCG